MRFRRSLRCGLAAVASAALVLSCAPAFEFDPWRLPVPAGTTTHGYPVVGPQDRNGSPIELVEELVIGRESADFNYLFGRTPPRVAVAADGRIFVLDGANRRIQAFDAEGVFLTSMGSRGQGPGELQQPLALVVEDETLRVYDVVNRRVTHWSLAGELLNLEQPDAQWGGLVVPVGNGEMVWRETERHPDRWDTMFRRVRGDGSLITEYARLLWPERVIDPPIGEISATESDAWWVGTVPPGATASAAGDVYVSPFDEYQVFAYAPDGTMRWALQVDQTRAPISQAEIDYFMEIHRQRFPGRNASQVAWPDLQYALADVKVDGHGHLYVFPYVPKGTRADAPRPVDVYSAGGERLYTGSMAGRIFDTAFAMYNGPMLEVAWQAVRGDHVWGLAEAPSTGDRQVVRYRLVEPF